MSGQYVHVVWYAYSSDATQIRRLMYRRSTDGGVTFGTAVVLLDTDSKNDTVTSVACRRWPVMSYDA